MTEVVTKFDPLAISVNEPEPAVAILGERLVNAGRGLVLVIVNVSELLVPPPGKGVNRVTAAVPGAVILVAGTVADNWVVLIKVVVSVLPFHLIVVPLMKLVPSTVSIKEALPAVALLGVKTLSIGTGLLGVMVKGKAELVPPPGSGVKTVTDTDPAAIKFVAGTSAVNCVGLIKLVARSTPFHLTTEPLTKLLPVTVSVKAALPAIAVTGLIETITGTGLFTTTVLMVKVSDALEPPPGPGV